MGSCTTEEVEIKLALKDQEDFLAVVLILAIICKGKNKPVFASKPFTNRKTQHVY